MENLLNIHGLILLLGIFILVMMLLVAYNFHKENETRPVYISVITGISAFLFCLVFFIFIRNSMIIYSVFLILLVLVIIFILPLKYNYSLQNKTIDLQLDERDIMFSRAELIPGSERYISYYKDKDDQKELDDKFRKKPGLLSDASQKYHPLKFASSDANFEAVEAFKYLRDNPKEFIKKKKSIDPAELSNYIKTWLKQIGSVSVGITELKQGHLYKIKGRGKDYGNEIVLDHPTAVALTVEMDKTMIDKAPEAETVMESSQQYFRSAALAAQLTHFIRKLGYSAKPHFDGNYDLLCTTVARDAGLGELGRMGLLMSHEIGPRVRIAVVTTDIPLVHDNRNETPSMIEFCKLCKKCADNCPVKAISFDDQEEKNGIKRWTVNHEACFTFWNVVGTDCAKCVQVCPYSHPDNLMHNLIRKGIDNSKLFAKLALKADDLFYGRNI